MPYQQIIFKVILSYMIIISIGFTNHNDISLLLDHCYNNNGNDNNDNENK